MLGPMSLPVSSLPKVLASQKTLDSRSALMSVSQVAHSTPVVNATNAEIMMVTRTSMESTAQKPAILACRETVDSKNSASSTHAKSLPFLRV